MEELSKVKGDLESALKDVLQAKRINHEAAACDDAVSIPSLKKSSNVSFSHALKPIKIHYVFLLLFFYSFFGIVTEKFC